MIMSHANFLLQSDDRMTNSHLAPSPAVEFTASVPRAISFPVSLTVVCEIMSVRMRGA